MSARAKQVLIEARDLSESERRLIVSELTEDDAEEGTPEELRAAWVAEVERRRAAHEAGTTTMLSWDEAKQRLSKHAR
jgi:putative addiction module component (TIGR02574 family)